MAKLHGFRCDRCGEEYPKNKSKNPNDKTGYNVIGFGFINTAKQIDRYDLCDGCIADLQRWMANPLTCAIDPTEKVETPASEDDEEEDE